MEHQGLWKGPGVPVWEQSMKANERDEIAKLVRAAQEGDGDAFANLTGKFEGMIRAEITSATGVPYSQTDPELQEILIQIWRYLHTCRPETFTAWVSTLARRKARKIANRSLGTRGWNWGEKRVRRHTQLISGYLMGLMFADRTSLVVHLRDRDDDRYTVRMIISQMNDQDREMLQSEFWRGESSSKQASGCGMSPQWCRKHRAIARNEFKRRYTSMAFMREAEKLFEGE